MPIVPVMEMIEHAGQGGYAIGYFECWNYESMQAVADAAEAARSPVLLGFSGLYLPHKGRIVADRLSALAAMGFDICEGLSVPAHLLFNESSHEDWIRQAIDLQFGMVMFTDENLDFGELVSRVKSIAGLAHQSGAAVEGEIIPLPGAGGNLGERLDDFRLTGIEEAEAFVSQTGVDTFAVNVGQAHWHGRNQAVLDLERVARLAQTLEVPLALHGASSIRPEDLTRAIALGIRKVNIGSRLKQAFFNALREACQSAGADYNPYEIVGSGLEGDVLAAGRRALQVEVERWMSLLGSAGKAG
jgi:ketose-bisphosphate aldolase